jgi:hypothetical protein
MKIIQFIKENKWLVLILALASFLRFYKLDFQSIWLDEIHTINESNPNNSFSDIYKILLITEPHPPLYFYIIHLFFKVFGYSVFVLRSFSAIIGIAGVLAIYFLGKEFVTKKTGVIASLLVAINPFHIYYSQEGRMYSLLFFSTVVSFYFLLKFIKKPNLKNALIHGIFAGLMIYSHFFALFALFAQYLFILFLILGNNNKLRKEYLKYTFVSGITTLLLYIPSLQLFFESTKRTSIWIPMPENDIYIQLFKEFFGVYKINYLLAALLIIIYLIMFFVHRKKSNQKEYNSLNLLLLTFWIIVVLSIPFILSHTKLPMIVSRYFINILPAILILVAFGISIIKNSKIKVVVISIIAFFSLNSIFAINKYYKKVNKTQFKETTQFITYNNLNNNPVVSSLAWYLPYFFDIQKQKIIDRNLDDYISEISKNSLNIEAFWYFDAHLRPYTPNPTTKNFIVEHFVIENNIDLFDSYAKHFVPKNEFKDSLSISEFDSLNLYNGDEINYNIESFEEQDDFLKIYGWAYLKKQEAIFSKVEILAFNKDNIPFILNSEKIIREDVTSYFKSSIDISNSGFKVETSKKNLKKGKYKVAILITNLKENKKGLLITDKNFEVN